MSRLTGPSRPHLQHDALEVHHLTAEALPVIASAKGFDPAPRIRVTEIPSDETSKRRELRETKGTESTSPLRHGLDVVEAAAVDGHHFEEGFGGDPDLIGAGRQPGSRVEATEHGKEVFVGARPGGKADRARIRDVTAPGHRLKIHPASRRQQPATESEEVVIDPLLAPREMVLLCDKVFEGTYRDHAVELAQGGGLGVSPVEQVDFMTPSAARARLGSGQSQSDASPPARAHGFEKPSPPAADIQ